jgi:hypothetical protein
LLELALVAMWHSALMNSCAERQLLGWILWLWIGSKHINDSINSNRVEKIIINLSYRVGSGQVRVSSFVLRSFLSPNLDPETHDDSPRTESTNTFKGLLLWNIRIEQSQATAIHDEVLESWITALTTFKKD